MSGPRRPRLRIALYIVGGLVAALAAATAGVWADLHATGVSTASIVGGALISPDGQTVSVTTALAPCGETDTLLAAEQPARVTLTLQYRYSKHPSCTGMPAFAVYSARLQAPLGHRRLVDGVTGEPVPFFDSRRMLRPGYLPPGYAFRYDAPDASELLTYQFPYLALPRQPMVSCSQLYSAGADELLVVMQATRRQARAAGRDQAAPGDRARPPGASDTRANQLDPGQSDDRRGHERSGAACR